MHDETRADPVEYVHVLIYTDLRVEPYIGYFFSTTRQFFHFTRNLRFTRNEETVVSRVVIVRNLVCYCVKLVLRCLWWVFPFLLLFTYVVLTFLPPGCDGTRDNAT